MRRNIMASEEESQRLEEGAAAAADKLLAEYERQTADVKARSEVWQRHLEDYTGLKACRLYFWNTARYTAVLGAYSGSLFQTLR